MISLFHRKYIKPVLAILLLIPVISTASMVAGTLVQTPHGAKPIETLKVGDLVFTYNEATAEIEQQPITFLYTRVANHLIRIEVMDADGQVTSIDTTEEHPFYLGKKNAQDKIEYQWQAAQVLQTGDVLLTQAKTPVRISTLKKDMPGHRVFNIEVAQQHNYFVSKDKVLVHNPKGALMYPHKGLDSVLEIEGYSYSDFFRCPITKDDVYRPGGIEPRAKGGYEYSQAMRALPIATQVNILHDFDSFFQAYTQSYLKIVEREVARSASLNKEFRDMEKYIKGWQSFGSGTDISSIIARDLTAMHRESLSALKYHELSEFNKIVAHFKNLGGSVGSFAKRAGGQMNAEKHRWIKRGAELSHEHELEHADRYLGEYDRYHIGQYLGEYRYGEGLGIDYFPEPVTSISIGYTPRLIPSLQTPIGKLRGPAPLWFNANGID